MVKKRKNSFGLNKRSKSLIASSLVLVLSILISGGSIGSYHYRGLLPQIKEYLYNKTEPISTTKQNGSGLYFSDGSAIPAYNGVQSLDVNYGKTFFTVDEKNTVHGKSYETYGGNDYLGRATGVVSVFYGSDLISSEDRPDLPDPAGWVGRSKGGIYDRSHLKAYTFGGRNDVSNLITGTVSLNQKYMVEVENQVRDLLYSSSSVSVLYRVTPFYLGDELLPRGVLMEVYSSNGSLELCKFIYNVQDNFSIDYSNGSVTEN